MPLRAVFFDLDGTLLDTARDLHAALNAVQAAHSCPLLPLAEARTIVSDGSFALVKRGFNLGDDDPLVPLLRQELLLHYERDLNVHTTAFPGIKTLISTLAEHGIAWGVVTNKPKPYALPLMQQFTFASEPVCVLSPQDVEKPKPHPESLHLACKLAECETSEAIYIGDHQRDIECGQRADMATIAVSYGYIPKEQDIADWHATHVADSADALWPIIKTYL